MADILSRIFAAKAQVRARDEARDPYADIRAHALASKRKRRNFLNAIRTANASAIIGEIKRASPSVGLIARNFDPVQTARAYENAGVDCISVLTEADHFLGDLSYLETVRQVTTCPLLRKDFLSTPYEVAQSAAYGADAILLIVASIDDETLRRCLDEAREYDLATLVEVHDAAELERAQNAGAQLIGINNRNLHTFETDLAVSEMLLPKVRPGVITVSESGMQGPDDIIRLQAAGARGFLIGEALMRSDDPARLIRDLRHAIHAPA